MSEQSERRSEMAAILEPDSVAVVGASRDEAKRGYQTVKALQEWEYGGEVYPVNPKYAGGTIRGLDVYESVADAPGPVDLAYVVTPASVVPKVLRDCGEAGVTGALVVAAGFGEVGNDDLERRVVEAARESGVRVVGPNINGFVNVHHGVDLLSRKAIPHGGIAMLSQSGNIASALVSESIHSGVGGFSFYVSVGNEADVRFHEYLPFLADHDETDVAMLYVEGMADGRSFLREAAAFAREKPIAVLKGGASAAGKQSARSHTASIAGSDAVIDDVYRQAGVVRVERSDELLAVADALASQPPADGPNVGVLSDGGGHATHAADSLAAHGLAVPELEPETQARLREHVPEQAPNVANPVDVLTLEYDVDLFYRCVDAMLADPNVDVLLLCGYYGGYGINFGGVSAEREVEVAERIAALAADRGTPVVAQTMFANRESPGAAALADSQIPTFESVNTATRCVAALETYGEYRATADRRSDFVTPDPERSPVVADAVEAGRTSLSEYETRRLLRAADAPVAPFERATSSDDAVAAAAGYDGPVAMKVLSPDLLHKSEAGGVALDVAGEPEVREAYDDLLASAREHDPSAALEGVLVSPMVEDGVEVVVGVTRDEEVGRVAMFGLGGLFVETLADVSFRGLPVTRFDAREMIHEIDGSDLLAGTRGRPGVDVDALVDLVCTVSTVACANPAIAELDVNPAIARPDGVTVVDAVATLDPDAT